MLTTAQREDNYWQQKVGYSIRARVQPGDRMTPRQRKRRDKKERAANGDHPRSRRQRRLRRLSEKLSHPAIQQLLSNQPCSRCGAYGEEPCLTADGNPARKPHKGRFASEKGNA